MELVSGEDTLNIHKKVINPQECNKSLDATISHVGNRIHYGRIGNVYDLTATYAVVIAVGHMFNDGDKKTATIAMDRALRRNGMNLRFNTEKMGDVISKVTQGIVNETELAHHLRSL